LKVSGRLSTETSLRKVLSKLTAKIVGTARYRGVEDIAVARAVFKWIAASIT
jgi:hypothetical protein